MITGFYLRCSIYGLLLKGTTKKRDGTSCYRMQCWPCIDWRMHNRIFILVKYYRRITLHHYDVFGYLQRLIRQKPAKAGFVLFVYKEDNLLNRYYKVILNTDYPHLGNYNKQGAMLVGTRGTSDGNNKKDIQAAMRPDCYSASSLSLLSLIRPAQEPGI